MQECCQLMTHYSHCFCVCRLKIMYLFPDMYSQGKLRGPIQSTLFIPDLILHNFLKKNIKTNLLKMKSSLILFVMSKEEFSNLGNDRRTKITLHLFTANKTFTFNKTVLRIVIEHMPHVQVESPQLPLYHINIKVFSQSTYLILLSHIILILFLSMFSSCVFNHCSHFLTCLLAQFNYLLSTNVHTQFIQQHNNSTLKAQMLMSLISLFLPSCESVL